METTTVMIKTGDVLTVTIEHAEKMKPHKWLRNIEHVYANISGRATGLARFLYDVTDSQIQCRRRDVAILDYTPANIYLWHKKERREIPLGFEPQGPKAILPRMLVGAEGPALPGDLRRVTTPPPGPAVTRPMFIDIDGRGMIVSVNTITRIDTTDSEVVEVELMVQQFPETGRDTKCVSFVYDGEQARYVRLWATSLADHTGFKLIEMVIGLQDRIKDRDRDQAINENYKAKYEASEAERKALIQKLRNIGFDPDKLI